MSTNIIIKEGLKIGKLTVLKKDILTEFGQKWLCQCDCGNITSVRDDNLINGLLGVKGGTRSCGCLNPVQNHCKGLKRIDRIGDIVNDYIYVLRLMPDNNRSYKFLVQDLTNGYWRITGPRWIKALEHNSQYEFKTAQEALNNYYKKLSVKKFSSYEEENNLMMTLFKNHFIWTKQFSFSDCKDRTPLPFDVAIFNKESFELDYLIEYDGGEHFFPVANWDFEITKKHDLIKNKYCFDNNIPLIRIPYNAEYTIDDLKLETTRFLLTPKNEKEYYESRIK